jgi:hypothetical protein
LLELPEKECGRKDADIERLVRVSRKLDLHVASASGRQRAGKIVRKLRFQQDIRRKNNELFLGEGYGSDFDGSRAGNAGTNGASFVAPSLPSIGLPHVEGTVFRRT